MSTTNPRPMYFGVIKIDPQTDSRIYVPGVVAAHLGRRRQDVPRPTAPSAFTSIITRCGSIRRIRVT